MSHLIPQMQGKRNKIVKKNIQGQGWRSQGPRSNQLPKMIFGGLVTHF